MGMRAKGAFAALVLSLGFGVLTGEAAARDRVSRCAAEIIAPSMWRVVNDPHGAAIDAYPFDIKITNGGGADCNGRIRVSTTNNQALLRNEASGDTIRYTIQDGRTDFDVTPPEFAGRPIAATLRVRPGQMAVNPYIVSVHPQGNPGAGEYIQYVTFDYVTPNSKEVLASRTIPIVYQVRSSARIGLKGEYTRRGNLRVIDLGELEDRTYSPRTVVTVDSTGSYMLSVTSENLGRLVNDDPVWSMPYRLRLGNQTVDLSRRYERSRISGRALNDEYPLHFSVDASGPRRAGRYSDVLHFTVTAL